MREALARSDLDFTTSEADSARRAEVVRLPKILRAACISTAVVVCGVIVVNALFLQDRKHPAPLLRAPDPAVTADPADAPRPVPVPSWRRLPRHRSRKAPPAARSGRDAIAEEINRAANAERKPARSPAATKSEGEKAERTDAIAGLIGASTEPSASVLAAQKALLRLGYVLRADGMAGATTRQAIERYERDNKLPVHGELTPKLARDLAAKSGVPAQ